MIESICDFNLYSYYTDRVLGYWCCIICLWKGEKKMPSAKKICIVCEKNISLTRGKVIQRCQQCNNAVCNEHIKICRLCNHFICDNELRKCDYCPFDQCKNCTIKYRKNQNLSYSLYCSECFTSISSKWLVHVINGPIHLDFFTSYYRKLITSIISFYVVDLVFV